MAPRKVKSTIKKTTKDTKPTQKSGMKSQKPKPGTLKGTEMPPVGGAKSKDLSGIMFIKHLPPGFLENQLKEFFGQFGVIKRVFVAKSERTKKSRGYGYVEFLYEDVAKIASEAINNYLMFGRLLQAVVVPKHYCQVPRNLMKGLGKNGQPNENHFEWVRKRINDYNGYSSIACQQSLRLRQKTKLQRALKELEQANLPVPAISECFVRVVDVCHLGGQVAGLKEAAESAYTDEDNSETEEEAFKVLQPSDWIQVDEKSAVNNERSEAAKQAAIKKANAKAESLKKKRKETDNEERQVAEDVATGKKQAAKAKILKKNK